MLSPGLVAFYDIQPGTQYTDIYLLTHFLRTHTQGRSAAIRDIERVLTIGLNEN